jgi:hypothetical protein
MFIKVTQVIDDIYIGNELKLKGGEAVNWVNSDNIDRIVEEENKTRICFASGNDIGIKESADELSVLLIKGAE